MTVGELLDRISSRELSEWMAFFGLEPFGEERADLRAGIVASTVANVNRGKGKRAFKPQEFMPQFGPGETKEPKDLLSTVEMLNAAFGGRDARRET